VENLDQIITQFEPITLEEMDGVKLMNRTDTKFMMSVSDLCDALSLVTQDYRILEVQGVRASRYETLYYDTKDFYFYKRHHGGKKNRYKIRKRSYMDSNLNFLEVKFKNSKDRTIKDRTRVSMIVEPLEDNSIKFIEENTPLRFELEPKIWNHFKRITLVNKNSTERLTIDLDLDFRYGDLVKELPQLVIAEVKQEVENRYSPFMIVLKKKLIRPQSISKYCLGVAMLVNGMKANAFKDKLIKIRKISYGSVS